MYGMGMGMGMMGVQQPGAAVKSVVTVRHPLYATCIYSASGLVPGTLSDLGDLSVLSARRVQLKITYEAPEQEQYWTTHSRERCEMPVHQGAQTWNQELHIGSDRMSGNTLFPAGPFTSVNLQLQHPASNVFHTFLQFGSRGQQPWQWSSREALPDTVELTAPALPIRRFRIVDKDGEPVRNAQFKVTLIRDQMGFWGSLFPKKIRPPRYMPIDTHEDLRTTYGGEAEFVIPEDIPTIVMVAPHSQGPPLPRLAAQSLAAQSMATQGRLDKLPESSFIPRSGEDIGDLILSATVDPGIWSAVPK